MGSGGGPHIPLLLLNIPSATANTNTPRRRRRSPATRRRGSSMTLAATRAHSPSRARASVCRLNEERGVAAEDPDHDEVPRRRADQQPAVRTADDGEQADQKRAGDIDQQRPPREGLAEGAGDHVGAQETEHATQAGSEKDPTREIEQGAFPARRGIVSPSPS